MSKKSPYQIVKQAIDEFDVYGLLEQGAPKDEFEEEALLITERISQNDSIQQIASVIAEVFNKEFTELGKGIFERYYPHLFLSR